MIFSATFHCAFFSFSTVSIFLRKVNRNRSGV